MKNLVLPIAALVMGLILCSLVNAGDCPGGVCPLQRPTLATRTVQRDVQIHSQRVERSVLVRSRVFSRCRCK